MSILKCEECGLSYEHTDTPRCFCTVLSKKTLREEIDQLRKELDTWKTEALLARDVMSRVTCLTFRGTNDQMNEHIISHKNYDNFVKENKFK